MNLYLLPGFALVSRDPIETQSHGGIHYPDKSHKVASTGICHLHSPGDYWYNWYWYSQHQDEDADVTSKRILFEKWAGRPLVLEDHEFWVIPEESILGICVELGEA